MNRINLLKTVLIKSVLFLLILHYLSANGYSFTSSEEYVSHIKGSRTCTTQECHVKFTKKKKKYVHEPVISGKCSACHSAETYPNQYGIEPNQHTTCTACHKDTNKKIQSSEFLHSPVTNGDCISCHAPHDSDYPFFLRQPYSKLCLSCHKVKSLNTGESLHKPVKDGNCGLCHEPHASNYKSRLVNVGANLCVICHDTMLIGMSQDYIHAPITQSGCTDCHDPHSGQGKIRLKSSPEDICFKCHKQQKDAISQYAKKHKPALEGQCTTCHSAHFSDKKFLLVDAVDTLCYKCHKDKSKWKEKRFKHGPVLQGNCTACHRPHGSDNAYILRLSFPHNFYTHYEKGTYKLCFLCHKEAIITEEKTETVTHFRNGDMNLHSFHVKQKKGRTCRACHNIHASDLEHHLREKFIFGKVSLPLDYAKTETGGSCLPACHRKRGYDRVEKVNNEFKKKILKPRVIKMKSLRKSKEKSIK
jgi:predicted CXXCH cytochrome family protein